MTGYALRLGERSEADNDRMGMVNNSVYIWNSSRCGLILSHCVW